MIETILRFFLLLMGSWLVFAGVWLAIEAVVDICRSRRLIFYQAVHLACAGSTVVTGLAFVIGK